MKRIHLALRHFVFSSTVQVSEEADDNTRPKVRGPRVIHQLRLNSESVRPEDSSP